MITFSTFLVLLALVLGARYLWCLTKPLQVVELWIMNRNIPFGLRIVGVIKGYIIWFPLSKLFAISYGLLRTKAPYSLGERGIMIGIEVLMLLVTLAVLIPLDVVPVSTQLNACISRCTYGVLRMWYGWIELSDKITTWQEQNCEESEN